MIITGANSSWMIAVGCGLCRGVRGAVQDRQFHSRFIHRSTHYFRRYNSVRTPHFAPSFSWRWVFLPVAGAMLPRRLLCDATHTKWTQTNINLHHSSKFAPLISSSAQMEERIIPSQLIYSLLKPDLVLVAAVIVTAIFTSIVNIGIPWCIGKMVNVLTLSASANCTPPHLHLLSSPFNVSAVTLLALFGVQGNWCNSVSLYCM